MFDTSIPYSFAIAAKRWYIMENPYQTTKLDIPLNQSREYLRSSKQKVAGYFVCCLIGMVTSFVTLVVCFSDQVPTLLGLTIGICLSFFVGMLVGLIVAFLIAPTKFPFGLAYLITGALAWLLTLASVVAFSVVFFAAPDEVFDRLFKDTNPQLRAPGFQEDEQE